MITVRKYCIEDLDAISKINNFLSIELQWNKDFHDEDAFIALDDMGSIVGILALFYGNTWYYIEHNATHIPDYYMNIECHVIKGHSKETEIKQLLYSKAKEHLADYKIKYPDKTIAIRCWTKDYNTDSIQFLLAEGFSAYGITPVLSYNLHDDIPTYTIPKNIKIGVHSFEGNGMQQYLTANALGFDNIQDSEAELRFRLNAPNTRVYTAKDGDTVVSSVTTWMINDSHSTTENIFTIPDYRHQNLARETIATVLRDLKSSGKDIASLTVLGRNTPAIHLYLGMGYTYSYSLFEMRYTL